MNIPLDRIVSIQNITPEVKISNIYETYSKAGTIEKIILGVTEALVFFADEDEAECSLVYETIGDIEVECSTSTKDTLPVIIEQVDYLELARQKEAQQAAQTATIQSLTKSEDDVEIIGSYHPQQVAEPVPLVQTVLTNKQEPEISKIEVQNQDEIQTGWQEPPKEEEDEDRFKDQISEEVNVTQTTQQTASTNNTISEQTVQQTLEGLQQLGSILTNVAKDIPEAIQNSEFTRSLVQENVSNLAERLPEVIQNVQSNFEERFSLPNPSIPATTVPTVEASVSPNSQSAAVPCVAEVTSPSVRATPIPSIAPPTVVPQVQAVKVNSTTTSDSCPFQPAQTQQTEQTSTLDSVQLLKTLKNTSLPERVQPNQNDLFLNVQNPKFLLGLLGIMVALILIRLV